MGVLVKDGEADASERPIPRPRPPLDIVELNRVLIEDLGKRGVGGRYAVALSVVLGWRGSDLRRSVGDIFGIAGCGLACLASGITGNPVGDGQTS